MVQYYIVEVQESVNGEFAHEVHWAWDESANKARLKAESKYHEVLAAAAVSETKKHSAIMFDTEGFPIMHQCYTHEPTNVEIVEETEE